MASILVIEDNALNMKLARSLLAMGGHEVHEALDAATGIELASARLPDLILMDIQLPDMDGLEATRLLKGQDRTRDIPVVALTSYAMPGDETKAREAGCTGYITKPINTRTFNETVGRYLSGQAAPPAPPAGFTAYRKKILVVDDDPKNVKLLAAKLAREKFEVLRAFSGAEALQTVQREHPDLILLDVMMPEMDGYEVSQTLKVDPATEHIPIILVTALDGSEDKIKGFDVGADEFLSKPVNDIELLTRVKSLLRMKQYRDQLLSRNQSEGTLTAERFQRTGEQIRPRPARILLVEDNEKDALLIGNVFAAEPYEVEKAQSGEEALERIQREAFDLVLLDVILPGLDGFEVCRQLKSLDQAQDVQVVLITALPDLSNKIRGVELGADDYLIKPIHGRELKARVRVLLKKKLFMDQLRNKFERAVTSAVNDGLTGLYNQTYFKTFLALEIKRAERQHYPIGLMMIDIDNFKHINDRHGHLTGDLIVRELSQLLKSNVREIDLSARYGGDEFAAVFPYADRAMVGQIAQRIQASVGQWRALLEPSLQGDPITISIGVAFYPEQATSMESLIRRADEALYQAKKTGKSRCCFFGEAEPEG
jgi:two-component system cell cycle response regulator